MTRTDVLLDPFTIPVLSADLSDLEPLCITGVELVAGCVSARGHIINDWPGVVGPLGSRKTLKTMIELVKTRQSHTTFKRDLRGSS